MKRIIILLIYLLLPISVNAAANGLIEVNVDLDGKDIKDYNFTFVLKDLEGNIIQKKKNSGNKVSFDPIKYNDSDIDKIYNYVITEENDSQDGIKYDNDSIYVSVFVGADNSKVAYVNPSWYNNKKTPSPFHATAEELEGEAYAVFDIDTNVLTFFRDEPNKYQNEEIRDNKVYFANFENIDYCSNDWVYNNKSYEKIEKIVFKDAIKPKAMDCWFKIMPSLKEVDMRKLDTSLVTSLYDFFYDVKNLHHLDISTMDVSNVTRLERAFKSSGIEELDFTLWDLEHLKGTRPLMEFAGVNNNLKFLDISNFEAIDSSAEFASLPCLEYVHLGNKFKFERALLDGKGPDNFIRLEDHKVFKSYELKIPYNVEIGTIGGHYVRPACTTTASFKNVYEENNKIEEDLAVSNEKNEKNPDTDDKIIILFIFMVSCLSIILYASHKRKLKI